MQLGPVGVGWRLAGGGRGKGGKGRQGRGWNSEGGWGDNTEKARDVDLNCNNTS